jgi:hypothetical protein
VVPLAVLHGPELLKPTWTFATLEPAEAAVPRTEYAACGKRLPAAGDVIATLGAATTVVPLETVALMFPAPSVDLT